MNALIQVLKRMGLSHLLKGFRGNPDRALIRIQKGESPYYALTKENNIDTSPLARMTRGMEEGYATKREDELVHGSRDDIMEFRPGTHFGTPEAANKRLNQNLNALVFQRPDSPVLGRIRDHNLDSSYFGTPDKNSLYATNYPVALKDKHRSRETADIMGDAEHWPLSRYFKDAEEIADTPLNRSEIEALHYENMVEDRGNLSYINTKPNVRSRHAMFNPNWRRFRDLLAVGLPLSLFTGVDD